jgi:tetratricopeptide (TPR) repeat protein
MAKSLQFHGLSDLSDYIMDLVGKRAKRGLVEKPPLSFGDVQDQIRSAINFMQLSNSQKGKDNYWLAAAYLMENLKYYSSVADMGKCGHVLLEIADCLFSCGEIDASSACCSEAITLLLGVRDQYEWAKGMAATGELLLAAILTNANGYKEAVELLRKVKATLPPKERRVLGGEDAHRVTHRLVAAYRTGTEKPLQELEGIPPRRKRTEESNLYCLLIEWMSRYNAVKTAVEGISPEISKNLNKHE